MVFIRCLLQKILLPASPSYFEILSKGKKLLLIQVKGISLRDKSPLLIGQELKSCWTVVPHQTVEKLMHNQSNDIMLENHYVFLCGEDRTQILQLWVIFSLSCQSLELWSSKLTSCWCNFAAPIKGKMLVGLKSGLQVLHRSCAG